MVNFISDGTTIFVIPEPDKSRLFEFQMMNVAILFLDGVNIARSYLSHDQ